MKFVVVANHGPWSHLHCGARYNYICKKPPGNVTITPPLPTSAPGNCPAGYEPFLDKCFMFSDDLKTWNESKYACRAQNTESQKFHLASIDNLQESCK